MFSLEPMNYMLARRGETGQVKQFDFATLQGLAVETEITSDGAVRTSGTWILEQNGLVEQSQAIALYDRLRMAGYPAKLRPLRSNTASGGEWQYSVFIAGFATANDASQLAIALQKTTGAQLTPRRQR